MRNREGREGTYEVVVLDTVGLAPGAHDVGIVVSKDGNNVDTLSADLGKTLEVLGDVTGGADGGEGTGEGEEDDLLVGPLLGGVVVDGDTAGGDLALLLAVGDVAVEGVRLIYRTGKGLSGGGKVDWKKTYEKTVSAGKLSPVLRPDILRDGSDVVGK